MKRWLIALVAAAGATALLASAFALYAPAELLDTAVEMGDRTLWLALSGVFAFAAVVARIALIRRRSPEERVSEPAPVQGGSHLR